MLIPKIHNAHSLVINHGIAGADTVDVEVIKDDQMCKQRPGGF